MSSITPLFTKCVLVNEQVALQLRLDHPLLLMLPMAKVLLRVLILAYHLTQLLI